MKAKNYNSALSEKDILELTQLVINEVSEEEQAKLKAKAENIIEHIKTSGSGRNQMSIGSALSVLVMAYFWRNGVRVVRQAN